MESKEVARQMRQALENKVLEKYASIQPKVVKSIKGKKKPSCLCMLDCGSKLVTAMDANEKHLFKSDYEMDPWTFAYIESVDSKKIRDVDFIVYAEKYSDFKSSVWFVHLSDRLKFVADNGSVNISLFWIDEHSNLSRISIDIVRHLDNVYDFISVGQDRGSKEDHNAEDKVQDNILEVISSKYPSAFVMKEFPVSHKEGKLETNKPYRIDILAALNRVLLIGEVKVGNNKAIEVIPQILDYYLHLKQNLTHFAQQGWDNEQLRNLETVICYLFYDKHHPLFNLALSLYENENFKIFQMKNEEVSFDSINRLFSLN